MRERKRERKRERGGNILYEKDKEQMNKTEGTIIRMKNQLLLKIFQNRFKKRSFYIKN